VVVPSVEPQRTLTLDQLLALLPRVREQDVTRLIECLEEVDQDDRRYEEKKPISLSDFRSHTRRRRRIIEREHYSGTCLRKG
jgi:hypothetical protein